MYQCNLCKYVFKLPWQLTYHLDERHNDDAPAEGVPPKYADRVRKHGNRRYSSEYGRTHDKTPIVSH